MPPLSHFLFFLLVFGIFLHLKATGGNVVTVWHFVATTPSVLPRTGHCHSSYYTQCGNCGNKMVLKTNHQVPLRSGQCLNTCCAEDHNC